MIDLPSDSDILLVLSQLPILVTRSVNPDDAALSGSQKVVQLLYRSETDLAREAYAALLERLCALSDKVAREVIAWLIYAEDEVCPVLFRVRIWLIYFARHSASSMFP